MLLKLMSRTQVSGQTKIQLQFLDVTNGDPTAGQTMPMMPMGGDNIQLGGWFDPTYAASLTVGQTYTMTLA